MFHFLYISLLIVLLPVRIELSVHIQLLPASILFTVYIAGDTVILDVMKLLYLCVNKLWRILRKQVDMAILMLTLCLIFWLWFTGLIILISCTVFTFTALWRPF